MARIKVIIAYDGANFYGFQKLSQARTVAGEIIKVLQIIDSSIDNIQGAGRTDKGVHALGQVIAFTTIRNMTSKKWHHALTSLLPEDIKVIAVEEVSDDFHPRFKVKSKTYLYKINTKEFDLFSQNYVLQYCRELDMELMNKLADLFVGEHDFTNFTTDSLQTKHTLRKQIFSCTLTIERQLLTIRIVSTGFLRAQVRMMVGAMIMVGSGKTSIQTIKNKLELIDLSKWTYKASACGLYLEQVEYEV